MDINKIQALFAMFTGEEYEEKFDPFIILAMNETGKQLSDDVPDDDPRLPFLCAALANYHFRLMRCSSDSVEYTYAGQLKSADQKRLLDFAERLLREYQSLCRDILKSEKLVFMGFSGKEHTND